MCLHACEHAQACVCVQVLCQHDAVDAGGVFTTVQAVVARMGTPHTAPWVQARHLPFTIHLAVSRYLDDDGNELLLKAGLLLGRFVCLHASVEWLAQAMPDFSILRYQIEEMLGRRHLTAKYPAFSG